MMLYSRQSPWATAAVLATTFTFATLAHADVKPASLFSDNAVLLADKPVPVWGWDTPGQDVTVTLGAAKATGKADNDGRWEVQLPAMKADGTAQDMTIAGSSTVTAKNVLVGEVWIDSGQSNMEFPLRWGLTKVPEFDKAVADANLPAFRYFKISQRWASDDPLPKDVVGKWEVCAPDVVGQWSAASFFFGRALQQQLGGTPVGIIDSTVGGTQIVAWITTKDDIALFPPRAGEQEKWAADARQVADLYAQSGDAAKIPPTIRRWPGSLYNGMVAPLAPAAVRGIVWYQGESNTYLKDADGYSKMLQSLVKSWRGNWKRDDLPFIIVQLPNYSEDLSTGKKAAYAGPNTKVTQADPVEDAAQWPPVREVQRRAVAALPNTALVVTIDIGTPGMIHPWNKWDLGQRLALAAVNLGNGKKDVVASGPIVASADFKGAEVTVKFTSIGGGLTAKDGGDLKGFALAGSDGKFAWAKATINGDSVTLTSDDVKDPAEVRYSWAENPIGNLINKEGLPASPFKLGANETAQK